MELYGGPGAQEPQAGVPAGTEETLNLGAWFQRSWTTVTNVGSQGADVVGGILNRFREADALGYDNDGDQSDN